MGPRPPRIGGPGKRRPMGKGDGECVVNNNNEIDAGFSLRRADRTTEAGGWLRDLALALAIAIALGLMGMFGVAHAQPTIRIGGNNRTTMVSVPIGKSHDVRTDQSFVDISVGDPAVADVNPLTDHSLSILAKKIGTTRVSVYSEGKKLIGIFDVEVTYDVTRLTNELKRRFPRSHIKASAVNGRIMLSGEVADAVTLDQAVTIARQFGPEIINSVSVMQAQQVLLEVRFIEIARNAGRDLGVQWNRFGSHSVANIGSRQPASNLPINSPSSGTSIPVGEVAAGVLSGGSPFGFMLGRIISSGVTTDVLINALEQKGVARSLAEPNLVALSGDTASFLAGGEYPIPVAGGFGQVTVDYKKYGVGLAFTPTVLNHGVINMKIEPEVSQIDTTHTVAVPGRHLRAGADRAPRLHHGGAARRPELRDRRPAADHQPQPDRAASLARQRAGAGRAVLLQVLPEEPDRSRHHRHAAYRAAGAAGRRGPLAGRRRDTAQRPGLLPARQDRTHASARPRP